MSLGENFVAFSPQVFFSAKNELLDHNVLLSLQLSALVCPKTVAGAKV
jgi:hypothetical protein